MNNNEKKLETKEKNSTTFSIIIIILVVILVATVAFVTGYYISENKTKGQETNINNNNQESIDNVKDNVIVDIDSVEGQKIKNSYDRMFHHFYDIVSGISGYDLYYHKSDKLLSRDMNMKYKIYLSIFDIINSKEYTVNDSDTWICSNETIESSFRKIFGSEIEYQYTELADSCPGSKDNGDGTTTILFTCGDTGMPRIFTQAYKIEKSESGDMAYVYELAGFPKWVGNVDENGNDIYNLYKDMNLKELVLENASWDSNSENLESLKDKLYTYKYTFKLENDNYYFYSVERIK